jgi:hypothetical protein
MKLDKNRYARFFLYKIFWGNFAKNWGNFITTFWQHWPEVLLRDCNQLRWFPWWVEMWQVVWNLDPREGWEWVRDSRRDRDTIPRWMRRRRSTRSRDEIPRPKKQKNKIANPNDLGFTRFIRLLMIMLLLLLLCCRFQILDVDLICNNWK